MVFLSMVVLMVTTESNYIKQRGSMDYSTRLQPNLLFHLVSNDNTKEVAYKDLFFFQPMMTHPNHQY